MISFSRLALWVWGILASASLFIPVEKLSSASSLCLFKFWWGVSCPGCGMGRSLIAAFQGRWVDSFHYHAMGLPFLLVWTVWLLVTFAPDRFQPTLSTPLQSKIRKVLILVSATGLLTVQLLRHIGALPKVS